MCGDEQRGEVMQPWSWLASCNVSGHPPCYLPFPLVGGSAGAHCTVSAAR